MIPLDTYTHCAINTLAYLKIIPTYTIITIPNIRTDQRVIPNDPPEAYKPSPSCLHYIPTLLDKVHSQENTNLYLA